MACSTGRLIPVLVHIPKRCAWMVKQSEIGLADRPLDSIRVYVAWLNGSTADQLMWIPSGI
jgi:hypothetical protein